MRIVIDARTMGSKPSGIGIYTYRYVKELMKSQHDITLITDVSTSEEMQYMKNNHVKVIEFGKLVYRSRLVFKYYKFVKQYLIKEQPDLFWEPNQLIPISLHGYEGKRMITIHDVFPITHPKYFGVKYSIYFRVMLRYTLQHTDIILYNSKETKRETEEVCKKAKECQNYVHYIIIPANEGAPAVPIKEMSKKDFFLYVGNMERRKGVDILLKAYIRYKDEGGDKDLILAGKSREKEIDELLDKLSKREPGIKYNGYVTADEKEQLYKECDCFIFPSMAEGFGICVVEAMHYYKPIIASNLTIFKEVAGSCIDYFDLSQDNEQVIANLSGKMFGYNHNVDLNACDEICRRYLPENAGNRLCEILMEIEK